MVEGQGQGHREDPRSLDRIATVPNALSGVRILLIPVFVVLIVHRGTELAGLLLLGGVVATDWVDGFVARRTGQVSNVGKLLDPVADRLALTAALVAMVVRHAFPLWAALLVIVRDAVLVAMGVIFLARRKIRLDVRWVGKAATFGLMLGIPLVAWGNFGLVGHGLTEPAGWVVFATSIVLYYVAAGIYGADLIKALRERRLA